MARARGAPPEVTVVNRQRTARLSRVRIAAVAEFVLGRERCTPGAQVAVILVGDAAIRALNRRWRGKDAATDVLSFPQREGAGGLHPEVLGDVVVSVPTALRQAREAQCCFAAEIDRLVTHGLLHLLGYEHEGDAAAARRMRRRETALRRAWRR
ncbi:MAG TPA: rRNA maturation RNase YbeY [bacterium]